MLTFILVTPIVIYLIGLAMTFLIGATNFCLGLTDRQPREVQDGLRTMVNCGLWPMMVFRRYNEVMARAAEREVR